MAAPVVADAAVGLGLDDVLPEPAFVATAARASVAAADGMIAAVAA